MRVRFFTSILALLAETVSAAPVVSLKEINPPAADTNRIVMTNGRWITPPTSDKFK